MGKIKSIANTHKTVQHIAQKAEKRVTIVQGGRDNAVEIKGKHQWQHQELVDKAGVEHSHKETAGKIDKRVKTVTGTKAPTIIKGGEKLGKKGTGKTVVVNKSPSAPAPAADHPDKEIAAKLIKQNSELTMKLQKVNIQVKSTPNDGAVIKVLKAQVKELQAKKTPKQTTIIKHTYHPPAPAPAPAPAAKKGIVITPAPVPAKPNCHKETKAKHPFANLEKNVKQIMKLKDGVERAQKGCESKAEGKVKTVQKEAQTKLEKSQKMVVAAKLTLKDRESEICDKSRKASEVSNKHQTHFWVGMVKEVRSKVSTKPPTVDHSDWKNKLCAAVHNDVQRMAGIKAVDYLQ